MIIQSKIPVLFPLKEKELPVQLVAEDGRITSAKVTVEGASVWFGRNGDGHFKKKGESLLEPAYIAYIERQLSRMFN